ncbi:putative bifunctional diguanylate cyclase/phosphodiesterase [Modestobacter roseus]|uniref:Diguanylate cyclase (GGDEF)-like protein n=1 Tax=Modestobacter roseus TaxID=1181884 RepID=A0A562ITR8_9ACTN|nr:bifunctional diguanylate cyclase/phosphodiesterase [Modestobacter roseus]MQA36101.1 EAL domain-containing protein [Modestobacter roseus]TWH74419.1 diguanylate cyclase (GGDEF)-like protein [Modestobacter roseus]
MVAVGTAAAVATVLLLSGTTAAGCAYLLVSTGAAAGAWYGDRTRPQNRRTRRPWLPIALTGNALGDLAWQLQVWLTGSAPGVSVADLGWLASYVALAAACLTARFDGRPRPGARTYALLDGAAALAVALLLVHHSSVTETLTDHGVPTLARLAWIGYPVLDAVVVGLIAWRVMLNGRVRAVSALVLSGALCWLGADLGWLLLASPDTVSGWLDVAWLAGILLFALIPWVPPSSPGGAGAAVTRPGHGPWRVAITIAPFTAPALVEVLAWQRHAHVNPVPGLLVWTVLLAISTVRTRLLVRDSARAWAAVRTEARRSEALALNSSDAVVVVDPAGRLVADSRSMAELLGQPGAAGDSLPAMLATIGVDPAEVLAALARARAQPGTATELELRGGQAGSGTVWLGGRAVDLLDDPDVGGIVVSVYDITPRKLAEAELAHQAFYDALTGLANRSLFLEQTEQALRRAGRTGTPPVVLCLDLDGFKDVNDSLGHLAGDELLRTVACRLRGAVRAADTVARLGGDEFAVLVDDPRGGLPEATELAQRLLDVIGAPIDLGGHRVSVAASIGVVAAEASATPLSLFRDADIAMYRAKTAGRAQWVVFDPEMRAAALERIELERQLTGALEAGQLRLVYQPVVDLATERVVGFEALLRWHHPVLGPIGPDRFVPVAEDSGLIVPIGRWVLAEATRTAARWQRAHPRDTPLSMAVNVSARQLAGGTLLGHVTEALSASGIPPSSLVLEVTETALVTDRSAVAARLAELRALGTRLALDDFGTGYSSLSWLRQFDVDVLKIDRSFVSLLDGSPDDAAIVHGLVQLGRTLRLEVVAEGVETAAQRDRLRAERCDLAQGYLFAQPLEEPDAELLLADSDAAAPRAPA